MDLFFTACTTFTEYNDYSLNNVKLFCRLLATQYPQLCLAEDWLDEEVLSEQAATILPSIPGLSCSPKLLQEGSLFVIVFLCHNWCDDLFIKDHD